MASQGNFDVREAKDGVEGIDLIRNQQPNLILLDFFMPRMNGWEVIQQVKDQPTLKAIPIVVMSGRKEEVIEKVPELFDYFEFIEKPFEQHALVGAIRSAMMKAKHRAAGTVPPPMPPIVLMPQVPAAVVAPPVAEPSPIVVPVPAAIETSEIQTLKAEIQVLEHKNAATQAEVDLLKKQIAQILAFLKQKFQ